MYGVLHINCHEADLVFDLMAVYMKLASIRRPGAGITLRSFSQIIHDLLRGKWQLLPRPVPRCHRPPGALLSTICDRSNTQNQAV